MESIEKIVAGIHALEPLPAVCTQVMKLAGAEAVVPSELIAVIQTDVSITAKVLRMCNSAYYGFSRQVGSIEEAGNRLGVTTLVNLVLTSCAGGYFKSLGSGSSARMEQLWERSISNALASSLLAGIQGDVDKNAAYTVGLLQDIGEVVIERFLPEIAKQIRDGVAEGQEQTDVETDLLGEDHAHIGALLAELWKFPETLVEAIRYHHDPRSASIAPELAATAHLADSITTTLAMTQDGTERVFGSLTNDVLRLVGLDSIGFDSLEEQVHAELVRAQEIISH